MRTQQLRRIASVLSMSGSLRAGLGDDPPERRADGGGLVSAAVLTLVVIPGTSHDRQGRS